jgi:methionyl-tRNA synthetase
MVGRADGYIASCDNWCSAHGGKVEDYFMSPGSEVVHVIGKDIIYHHFLFWPSMLLGAGIRPAKKMHVHGFLTVNGEKMSKSRGTFILASTYLKKLDRCTCAIITRRNSARIRMISIWISTISKTASTRNSSAT